MSAATRQCGDGDLEAVRRALEEDAEWTRYRSALDYAWELEKGTAPDHPNPALALAECHLQASEVPRWIPGDLYTQLRRWVPALLASPQARAGIWSEVSQVSLDRSPSGPVARLEAGLPPVGRLIRMGGRFMIRAAGAALAMPIAGQIRRAAR